MWQGRSRAGGYTRSAAAAAPRATFTILTPGLHRAKKSVPIMPRLSASWWHVTGGEGRGQGAGQGGGGAGGRGVQTLNGVEKAGRQASCSPPCLQPDRGLEAGAAKQLRSHMHPPAMMSASAARRALSCNQHPRSASAAIALASSCCCCCRSPSCCCRCTAASAAGQGPRRSAVMRTPKACSLQTSSLAMEPKPTTRTLLPCKVCPRGTPSRRCWMLQVGRWGTQGTMRASRHHLSLGLHSDATNSLHETAGISVCFPPYSTCLPWRYATAAPPA